MIALFWLVFGLGFGVLIVAAGISLHARRKDAFASGIPVVDDDVIEQIIQSGAVYVDEDEPLDLGEIDDEEQRFWSESWDEPTGDW